MAILEDKVADTSTVYDTYGGEIRYSGKAVGILIREDMEKYLWLEDRVILKYRYGSVYENYKNNLQNLSTM
jgi:cell division protein FtsI (penicillin-binding protein 3)